ncbi:MAG: RNA polymerase-binding protein DksA [Alphaproteobacteria bacterium]
MADYDQQNRRFVPSENEAFMSPDHVRYFRDRLLSWKYEIIEGINCTMQNLKNENNYEADEIDMACQEISHSLEIKVRDRERKLLYQIDEALKRIEEGTYGYCEETGEPIGLKRLVARPVATLSIEAQEQQEKREKNYRTWM